MKIRRTEWEEIFWENSKETVYDQDEASFYSTVEKEHCYYDEAMDLYYTPDNSVSYEILEM